VAPADWPDGPPNLYAALLTKLIHVQGRFLSLSLLTLFYSPPPSQFYSPCLLCFISSFFLPFSLSLLFYYFRCSFLPSIFTFLLSFIFICSFPSLVPIPLFLLFPLFFPSHIYLLLIFLSYPCFP
jgi:hypothetical protein